MKKAAVWYKNRRARVASAILALLLAYLIASLAIDTGSLWTYFGTIVFFVLSIRFSVLAIKKQ